MKNNKAVTLVALIITIIILLILAGVVIAMTVGDEGIINKSQQAVDKYQNSAEKEQELLGKVDSLGTIELNETSITLQIIDGIAETKELKVTKIALDGEVTWSSSNTSIATVNNAGIVTAVGGGTTKIVATCEGKSTSCEVTVKEIKVIYNRGNQYTEITNGWNVSKDTNGIADVNKYKYILMNSKEVGYRGSVVCTNKAIDISSFSKLKIKLKKTSQGTYNIFRYGINKTKMTGVAFNAFGSGDRTITNSNTKAVTTYHVGDDLEVELDISQYTGEYFIGFDLDTCYVEIYKVWLE